VCFVSNPGGVVSLMISETVTILSLGFSADGNGAIVNVTQVTLVHLGTANTMAFCGDPANSIPNHSES
jgi:hypothetical protein